MSPQSTAERVLYFFGRLLVRCFYRVTALGLENLPTGGFLLVPNHITLGGRARPAARLPTADPLRHRPGILSQADFASDPAHDWVHPD